MTRIIKSIALLTIAASLTTGCQKSESPIEDKANTQIRLFANDENASAGETKTTLNNSTYAVAWNDADNLTVFNAQAGTDTYSDNCKFLISDPATGAFVKDATETGKTLYTEGAADWYVCCPWYQYPTTPSGTAGYTINRTPKQIGYNSTAHLTESDIMVGRALNTTEPDVTLKHMATLMKFTVTNNSGSATTITGITLDATASGSYITGSYKLDFTGASPALDPSQMGSTKAYTSVLNVCKDDLTPIEETIADGASADFYMIVAPFTISAGNKIIITVYGSNGRLVIEKTAASEMKFEAGKYNTASISYNNPEKAYFTENFGTVAVATANVPSYGKSGLWTMYSDDAADYSYASYNNASFQTANYTYVTKTATGAYVRFPKENASVSILNIDVHGSTNLTFSYTKDVAQGIAFRWRINGDSAWTTVETSTVSGSITHTFDITNPEGKNIDITLQLTEALATAGSYPTADNFKLVGNN